MKNKLCKWLCALAFAACLTTSAFAHHGGGRWGGGFYFGIGGPAYYPYYYSPNYYPYYGNGYYGSGYYRCAWVRGHYNPYGYWVPSHRVCWY